MDVVVVDEHGKQSGNAERYIREYKVSSLRG